MRKAFILLSTFLVVACTNIKQEKHISFMSVPLDGSISEFLRNIETNSSNKKGDFSDCLEFQVDSVNYEKESFYCSYSKQEELMSILEMNFEVSALSEINEVAYIRGMTLMADDALRVFNVCLYESLGIPTYMGVMISDKDKESWSILEHLLFDTMSKNFMAWKLPNGYVIVDSESAEKYPGYSIVLMFVVDNENYCRLLVE